MWYIVMVIMIVVSIALGILATIAMDRRLENNPELEGKEKKGSQGSSTS